MQRMRVEWDSAIRYVRAVRLVLRDLNFFESGSGEQRVIFGRCTGAGTGAGIEEGPRTGTSLARALCTSIRSSAVSSRSEPDGRAKLQLLRPVVAMNAQSML